MSDLSGLLQECAPLSSAKKPAYAAVDIARRMDRLGFTKVAKDLTEKVLLAEKMECIKAAGYLVITDEKIQKFLDRQAKEYNERAEKRKVESHSELAAAIERLQGVQSATLDDLLSQTYFGNSVLSMSSVWSGASPWASMPYGDSVTVGTGQTVSATLCAPTRDALNSRKGTIGRYTWTEVDVKDYDAIPPDPVLEALERAQAKEIFHYFTIGSVNAVKDPLLLGRLNGVPDRFYITAWGEDIALDDVI